MRNTAGVATFWIVFASVLAPAHAQDVDWFVYTQLSAETSETDSGVAFDANTLRGGLSAVSGRYSARIQLDVRATPLDVSPPGTLANVIKDVYVAYAVTDSASFRFGQFKTPVGMDFSLSGRSLDIATRGMEKGLVLERDLGAMFSTRKLGNGFGLDLGVFNPAGRSAATSHVGSGADNQTGNDLATAARLLFDPNKTWHAEVSWGSSQNAGGPGTQDYTVVDAGISWQQQQWMLKGEFIAGSDVRGVANRDESVWYAHAGYAFSPLITGLVRHYQGESTVDGTRRDLANTHFGFTFFLDPDSKTNSRLMLNYVLTGGDTRSYTGVRGFRDNTVTAQFQVDIGS